MSTIFFYTKILFLKLFILKIAINCKFSIINSCKEILIFENSWIMTKTKYSNQLSQFMQKSSDELEELSQAELGDAFLDHMLKKFDEHIWKWGKILLITLTKKSSEEITNFLISKWYKAFYLHSEVQTMDRWEIIKKLKTWVIDIIVWVNLLREGIDLPEVTLIAVLDADKEWFLRSTTSLTQIIWRAARNPNSEVVLYADSFTESMVKSLWETYRRRTIQNNFNIEHHITPKAAHSNVKNLESVKTDEELVQQQNSKFTRGKVKRLKRMTKAEKNLIMKDLKSQMDEAIKEWRFEDAAVIRDQIKELEEGE